MASIEETLQVWMRDCQERVEEPVLGVVGLSRSGSLGNLGIMKLSPLAAIASGAADKRASGLPESVTLAITATAIYVFSFRTKRNGVKLKDELAVWPREGMQVACEPGAATYQIQVTLADGSEYALEANKLSLNFNGPGLRMIGAL